MSSENEQVHDDNGQGNTTKELTLNQLTREQLASLSKHELIELLTKSNSKKTKPTKRRSKSPRKTNPKNRKRNNVGVFVKTKSQSHMEKSKINAAYDSQSEQPSEQRNSNILKNPLPPEQEERETPKSEPESSDDQRKSRARALTVNDALLSSTDGFDFDPPKIRTLDPVQFEDISALERSVESDDGDDEDENKFNTLTSEENVNNNQQLSQQENIITEKSPPIVEQPNTKNEVILEEPIQQKLNRPKKKLSSSSNRKLKRSNKQSQKKNKSTESDKIAQKTSNEKDDNVQTTSNLETNTKLSKREQTTTSDEQNTQSSQEEKRSLEKEPSTNESIHPICEENNLEIEKEIKKEQPQEEDKKEQIKIND